MDFSKIYLDGAFVSAVSEDRIAVEDPADLSVIAEVPACGGEDVDRAIESAQRGFEIWRKTAPEERAEKVSAMIEYLIASFERIAPILARELGCTETFALSGHLEKYVDSMRDFLEVHKDVPYKDRREGYTVFLRPVGIFAALTPWNYPFGQIVRKVIPALLAGNAVILKPSKSAPLTAYFWAEAAHRAKIPKGVFNLITGRGAEIGNRLAEDPRVQGLSFTGSTSGGEEVASIGIESSAKRILLEMGGKSAAIYFPDLDEDEKRRIIEFQLNTLYANVGQTCSALSRMLVPRAELVIYEALVVEITKERFHFGNPKEEGTTVGVLNGRAQFNKVRKYVKKGLEEGARLVYGDIPEFSGKDYRVGPVVFSDVLNHMAIAQEEIFGPVLSIIAYDTLDDAIAIANDSIYGLSGMVAAPDEERAIETAANLYTGQVIINGNEARGRAPFGGFKESGIGRECDIEGLMDYYEVQTLFY